MAERWLKKVAAVVAEQISSDRRTWKTRVNRPLDIFFSDEPPPAHARLRERVQAIYDSLIRAHLRRIEIARSESRSDQQVTPSAFAPCFTIMRPPSEPAWHPLVVPGELFVPALVPPISVGVPGKGTAQPVRTLGDQLSATAVSRLDQLLSALEQWACDADRKLVSKLLLEIDLKAIRTHIQAIEEDLLYSQAARASDAFIVLAKVYYAFRAPPDYELLAVPDRGAIALHRRSHDLATVTGVKRVKGALSALLGGHPPVQRPVSLREFLQHFCKPVGPKDNEKERRKRYQSILHRINQAAYAKRIELPEVVRKGPREVRMFRPKDLMRQWSGYQHKVSSLPDLRPEFGS